MKEGTLQPIFQTLKGLQESIIIIVCEQFGSSK